MARPSQSHYSRYSKRKDRSTTLQSLFIVSIAVLILYIIYRLVFRYHETIEETYASGATDTIANAIPAIGVNKSDVYCEAKGMAKAAMPQQCFFRDGTFFFDRNCRCAHKQTGECMECYPPINFNQDDTGNGWMDIEQQAIEWSKGLSRTSGYN